MVISLKRLARPAGGVILLTVLVLVLLFVIGNKEDRFIMGGYLHSNKIEKEDLKPVFQSNDSVDYSERFQRPSKLPAIKLKYAANLFLQIGQQTPM